MDQLPTPSVVKALAALKDRHADSGLPLPVFLANYAPLYETLGFERLAQLRGSFQEFESQALSMFDGDSPDLETLKTLLQEQIAELRADWNHAKNHLDDEHTKHLKEKAIAKKQQQIQQKIQAIDDMLLAQRQTEEKIGHFLEEFESYRLAHQALSGKVSLQEETLSNLQEQAPPFEFDAEKVVLNISKQHPSSLVFPFIKLELEAKKRLPAHVTHAAAVIFQPAIVGLELDVYYLRYFNQTADQQQLIQEIVLLLSDLIGGDVSEEDARAFLYALSDFRDWHYDTYPTHAGIECFSMLYLQSRWVEAMAQHLSAPKERTDEWALEQFVLTAALLDKTQHHRFSETVKAHFSKTSENEKIQLKNHYLALEQTRHQTVIWLQNALTYYTERLNDFCHPLT